MNTDERSEAAYPTEQDATTPDRAPRLDTGHTGRGLRVRLIAFVLLLGVSAAFFDFSGLLREASPGPLLSSDLSIDGAGLPSDLGLHGHGVEQIDGQTFVVIRLAWGTPEARADAVAPRLRATLLDGQGESLGWQLLEASPSVSATARHGPTYRLRLPQGVRPARIALEAAE